MPACQAGLGFHTAEIRSYEIEFIATAEIGGNLSSFQQIHIQENRYLESRQARPVNIPDATHEIDPLVVSAQTGARPNTETGSYRLVR